MNFNANRSAPGEQKSASENDNGSSFDVSLIRQSAGQISLGPNVLDLEKGSPGKASFEVSDSIQTDPDLVTWDGPDDPGNPYNWPPLLKWSVTLLTSFGGLVTLMSGSMIAPALGPIGEDLHIGVAEAQLTLSIFVLAFAFGPLVLAPLTEIFGRKPVWIIASLWYVLWNTICGFARSNALMITARFLAGLGASGEFAVSSPVLSDCWRPEQRGKSFAISTFVPLLGPAIGPPIGGLITQGAGWAWIFWTVSIFDALLILWALFFFRETYEPTILSKKAKNMRKTSHRQFHTEFERLNPTLGKTLAQSLTRPVRLLLTQPTIQLMSLFLAYNFGLLYIVLSTFATLWTDRYHQPISTSGLHYIALAIGYTVAAQVGGRVTDRIWKHLKTKTDGATSPEYRVPLMIPGALLIPIGLLWYGWTADSHAHWILPDIGAAIFGCGIILGTQAMQAYILDAYSQYTASAMAAAQLLRSITGFAFPAFAPGLYEVLGYGWGNSLLAFVFMIIGVPAPLLLWKYGAKIRARGRP